MWSSLARVPAKAKSIVRSSFIATSLGLLGFSIPAHANTIVNPGFETGNLTGWTCTGVCEAEGYIVHAGSSAMSGHGNSWSTLSQTIATTPGTLYDFSFWSAEDFASGGKLLEYSLDGANPVSVAGTLSFSQTAASFVAGGSSATISFLFVAANGAGIWIIDDVSVSPSVSTTPIPAALPLLATGLGVLGLLGWCKKRKAKTA
jgi:hypothetical protein